MNLHLIMGLFAFYVVAVSLLRLLADREYPLLTAMKRAWGRRPGLAMHFIANVALPLVFGIVFFSRGVVGGGADLACDPALQRLLQKHAARAAVAKVETVPLSRLVEGLSDPYGCAVRPLHAPATAVYEPIDLEFSVGHLFP